MADVVAAFYPQFIQFKNIDKRMSLLMKKSAAPKAMTIKFGCNICKKNSI